MGRVSHPDYQNGEQPVGPSPIAAYVHTAESIRPGRLFNPDVPRVTPHIRANYDGTLITNGGYDKTAAANAIRTGTADAVAFGQFFIANPDLPERIRIDAQLNHRSLSLPNGKKPHGPKSGTEINHLLRRLSCVFRV